MILLEMQWKPFNVITDNVISFSLCELFVKDGLALLQSFEMSWINVSICLL